MKRGEVWWVNFEPAVGGEVRKQRPAVIVSNDVANKHLNRVQVIPWTTNVDRVYPNEARLAAENNIDSSENRLQLSARKLPTTFRELPLVQSYNPRNVSNRVLWQISQPGFQKDNKPGLAMRSPADALG